MILPALGVGDPGSNPGGPIKNYSNFDNIFQNKILKGTDYNNVYGILLKRSISKVFLEKYLSEDVLRKFRDYLIIRDILRSNNFDRFTNFLYMFKTKDEVRKYVWKILVEKGQALPPFPIEGRIPNFKGSDIAAFNITKLKCYTDSKYIMVNPDSPQKKVREIVLKQKKILIVPTPKLKHGFRVIFPEDVSGIESYAVTIKGIYTYGKVIDKPERIDLVIMGSVAVDIYGNRIGKGGGFGDREISIARRLNRNVKVITTVHDLQVFKEELPHEEHDEKVDIIVTPTRILRCIQ